MVEPASVSLALTEILSGAVMALGAVTGFALGLWLLFQTIDRQHDEDE